MMPRAAELMQGLRPAQATVRIIRPDGTMRSLALRSEIRVTPDGRPFEAAGVILDVTDPQVLIRARQAEQRHRGAIFRATGIVILPVSLDMRFDFPAEAAATAGRSLEDLNADPFAEIVPEERARFIESAIRHHAEGTLLQETPLLNLRDEIRQRVRIVSVPVHDEAGAVISRSCVMYPTALPFVPVAGSLRRGLEQAVRGHHLRAARALLGWSMTTLAQASGLSLSTVRRLEEETQQQAPSSHHSAIAALRQAGIRFVSLDDGAIAVARD